MPHCDDASGNRGGGFQDRRWLGGTAGAPGRFCSHLTDGIPGTGGVTPVSPNGLTFRADGKTATLLDEERAHHRYRSAARARDGLRNNSGIRYRLALLLSVRLVKTILTKTSGET
jgi:hypothetical protein